MRFGIIHRVMTDSLAALGVLALVTSGKLHPWAAAAVLIGLVVGIFLPVTLRQGAFVKLTGVVGPLSILTIQMVRLSLGGDPIPIVVEFAAALQVVRLATRRGAAHDHQIILLSLLHLIAGTVLGGGLTYAMALMGFLIFTPGALVLSHLRREVEGNYRQGARDRTGMPVDVPRILRSRRVIGRGFLLFTCSLSIPVFLFSSLLFLMFPRVGFAWLNVPSVQPSRVVGFSDRVDLGGVGTIRTDPTLVMRVKASDAGDEPALRRNLYLRGAVFDTYDGRSWSRRYNYAQRAQQQQRQIILRRHPRATDRTLLIDLDRIDPPVVFVPGEAVALDILNVDRMPYRMQTTVASDSTGQLHYSTIEREGLSYRVYLPPRGLIVPERTAQAHLGTYLSLPSELSPRIRDLANKVTRGKDTPLEIATELEKHLRTAYRYDLGSPSGGAQDPLEHFLFESKRGHCEFYSTAMAMMLRVRGVPSRNVTGFVGGTYNRFGEFYAVRQGDAHSWVEAYLPERGWIRFDPTPPSSAEPQARTQGLLALLREMMEAASENWRQNVVGYDMDKQIGIVRAIRNLFAGSKTDNLKDGSIKWNLRRVAVGGLGVLLVVLGVLAWRRRRPIEDPEGEERLSPAAHRSIELYRKLELVLESKGMARPRSTPPLTYARSLMGAGHPLAPDVLALTEIYLRTRFGGQPLSEPEARQFSERVGRIKKSILEQAA